MRGCCPGGVSAGPYFRCHAAVKQYRKQLWSSRLRMFNNELLLCSWWGSAMYDEPVMGVKRATLISSWTILTTIQPLPEAVKVYKIPNIFSNISRYSSSFRPSLYTGCVLDFTKIFNPSSSGIGFSNYTVAQNCTF